jgi:hypothetical protein
MGWCIRDREKFIFTFCICTYRTEISDRRKNHFIFVENLKTSVIFGCAEETTGLLNRYIHVLKGTLGVHLFNYLEDHKI